MRTTVKLAGAVFFIAVRTALGSKALASAGTKLMGF